MQPRFTFVFGTLGLAAALVAAPVGFQDQAASLCDKAAFAAGNGNGGGNSGNGGKGGNGRGHGHGGGQGLGNSLSDSAEAPGKSGSAPGHGGSGEGQAVGHDAVSGVSAHAAHQNAHQKANSLDGNMNAAHASAQAFANASSKSMIGAIREAVQESYVSKDDDDAVIGQDEINLEALESALMGPANKDVDADTAAAVAAEVDGKVSEPDAAGP